MQGNGSNSSNGSNGSLIAEVGVDIVLPIIYYLLELKQFPWCLKQDFKKFFPSVQMDFQNV